MFQHSEDEVMTDFVRLAKEMDRQRKGLDEENKRLREALEKAERMAQIMVNTLPYNRDRDLILKQAEGILKALKGDE